jgi:hypothetical protein
MSRYFSENDFASFVLFYLEIIIVEDGHSYSPVRLSYNLYFSAYFFSRNSIFFSQQYICFCTAVQVHARQLPRSFAARKAAALRNQINNGSYRPGPPGRRPQSVDSAFSSQHHPRTVARTATAGLPLRHRHATPPGARDPRLISVSPLRAGLDANFFTK